jgi:hypothetical protein
MLYEWAIKYGWLDEARRRDRIAEEKLAKDAIARKVKLTEAKRKAGELQYLLGQNALVTKKVECKSVSDAINLIEKGFALASQAEGLPDWVGIVLNADEDDLKARRMALARLLEQGGSGAGVSGDRGGGEEAGDQLVIDARFEPAVSSAT